MSDVSLSKAVRSNLLSLQNTASMMAKTQERLATGNKVNSALDNPTNFFTASALNSRAGDMSQLLDSMANGIQTLEAADNGLSAITKNLESMQSTLRQARQDKSFQTESFTVGATTGSVTLNGGAVGTTDVTVGPQEVVGTGFAAIDATSAGDITIQATGLNDGAAVTVTLADGDDIDDVVSKINAGLDGQTGGDGGITASNEGGQLRLLNANGETITLGGDAATLTAVGSFTTGDTSTAVTSATVDELVTAINNNSATEGKVRASNDNGSLRIENLSTQDLSATVGTTTSSIGGNEVRADLAEQYNELRDQLDKLADDASFNGVNLLRGDNLKITFNETGTSELDIQTKDGESINAANLGLVTNMEAADFDSDADIDAFIDQVKSAIGEVRSQSSAFGSSLSIVQNREDFTKAMINTLETGAGNLTLADTNEEAANLLALQTRQQLSSTALSMASQADQAVLRLF